MDYKRELWFIVLGVGRPRNDIYIFSPSVGLYSLNSRLNKVESKWLFVLNNGISSPSKSSIALSPYWQHKARDQNPWLSSSSTDLAQRNKNHILKLVGDWTMNHHCFGGQGMMRMMIRFLSQIIRANQRMPYLHCYSCYYCMIRILEYQLHIHLDML